MVKMPEQVKLKQNRNKIEKKKRLMKTLWRALLLNSFYFHWQWIKSVTNITKTNIYILPISLSNTIENLFRVQTHFHAQISYRIILTKLQIKFYLFPSLTF